MTDQAEPQQVSITNRPGAVERAYQLAREGKDMNDIRRTLASEHYSDAQPHLTSPTLVADLRRLAKIAEAELSV